MASEVRKISNPLHFGEQGAVPVANQVSLVKNTLIWGAP